MRQHSKKWGNWNGDVVHMTKVLTAAITWAERLDGSDLVAAIARKFIISVSLLCSLS
jgi:hypothetical protein